MDQDILLHFGGSINEQFVLVGMRAHVLTFRKPPSFNELVARVRTVMNVGCELRLHGRYDMWGNIPIYVMLPLGSEDEWQLYKSCTSQSGLNSGSCICRDTQSAGYQQWQFLYLLNYIDTHNTK
jgi:hypothetical protein